VPVLVEDADTEGEAPTVRRARGFEAFVSFPLSVVFLPFSFSFWGRYFQRTQKQEEKKTLGDYAQGRNARPTQQKDCQPELICDTGGVVASNCALNDESSSKFCFLGLRYYAENPRPHTKTRT